VSLALAGQVAAQSDSASHLEKEAAKLDIHFGTGSTVGAKIESKLSPRTRAALNAWAPVASRLSLTVAVPQKAEALVLGLAPVDTVAQAARWIDDACKLFDDLKPGAGGPAPAPIVLLLLDKDGFASPAWTGLVDEMVARELLSSAAADVMRGRPGSYF